MLTIQLAFLSSIAHRMFLSSMTEEYFLNFHKKFKTDLVYSSSTPHFSTYKAFLIHSPKCPSFSII